MENLFTKSYYKHNEIERSKKEMKKLFPIILIAIVFFSCSKSSNASATSEWTFEGVTYNGTTHIGAYNFVITSVNSNNTDSISFSYSSILETRAMPLLPTLNPSQSDCVISIYHAGKTYISTGKNGDEAHVTVTNGKVTVSFANITVENAINSDVETVSGNLIYK
jgi:hypothetical protein